MSKTKEQTKNVFQRIHAVMGDMDTINKNGKNAFHGYDYATEADFIRAVKPLLLKHGLTMTMIDHNVVDVRPLMKDTSNFSGKILATVISTYNIVNIDDPQDYTYIKVSGQGIDNGDKAVYKAITGAKKYGLANAFMAITGDDPEKDEQSSKPKVRSVKKSVSDF